jgi:ribosomal protein S18 acetylase RimI-like enzyme/predicted GIY-YIG superfamily endonuclease
MPAKTQTPRAQEHARGGKPKPKGYVYVLHFEAKLAGHAQHYVGCTADPLTRLVCHAHGHSSSIMRAVKKAGIPFRLAYLGECKRTQMKRLERQCKGWKNAHEFCEVCRGQAVRAVAATTPLPLEMLPFPITSEDLLKHRPPPPVTISRSGPKTPVAAVEAMIRFGKEEAGALGFIPTSGLGSYTAQGQVMLAYAGKLLVGYCLFGKGDGQSLNIQQTCVADGYRGLGIGRRLVQAIIDAHPGQVIRAKVRDDLHANGFWAAIGFKCPGDHTHRTSANVLHVWTYTPKGK